MNGKPFTIGRRGFAKISAVEGLVLEKKYIATLRRYEEQGLRPSERRKAILATFVATH